MSPSKASPVLIAIVAALTTQSAQAETIGIQGLEVANFHPRIFIHPDDVARMRARVGIEDGTNMFDHPGDWEMFLDEYADLIEEMDHSDYDGLNLDSGSVWALGDVRSYTVVMGNLAMAYMLNAHRSEGEQYRVKALAFWEQIIADSRARNGGNIGRVMSMNRWGKNANWAGFCIGYDYLYDAMSASMRQDAAAWIYAQTDEGWSLVDRNVRNIDHYYVDAWITNGVFAGMLTVAGDAGVDPQQLANRLAVAHDVQEYASEVRAKNYCGTYSGYRYERIEEDVSTAMAWKSATDQDPFVDFAYHYANLDDWVMHMCRPNFHESDETGHSHDLYSIRNKWIHFAYPSAVHDANPYTLWFLDQALEYVGLGEKTWATIIFNDKTIVRQQPTQFSYPLSRYFGDTTFEDGNNSQYTHFRSAWSYGTDESSTVMASFLCGPFVRGHDLLSQGHLAIFRGDDIISASTGLYDGTNFPHTRYWHQAPISENTILVADPNNWYAHDVPDSMRVVYHKEGMQANAPGTTGGGSFMSIEGPYEYQYESGHVQRFTVLDNGDSYLHANITSAYPNTAKADLWTQYQSVENVTRQITFQHGNYFVLLDRVRSTNPDATKRVLMHNPDPSGYTLLDGSWNGGVAPHAIQHGGTPGQSTDDGIRYTWERGGSRAYATALYPMPESMGGPGRLLVRVGGLSATGQHNGSGRSSDPSYEFWMREIGTNYRWTEEYISDTEENNAYDGGWAGYWRMEIEATGANEHTFLHVYEITDRTQGTPTPVDYLEEVDPGHVGCAIDDPRGRRVNLYSRDEEPDTGVYYRSALEGPLEHLVADLVAGIYLVEGLDSGETLTVSVDEGLHVASFETDGSGRFRLTRLSDLAQGR